MLRTCADVAVVVAEMAVVFAVVGDDLSIQRLLRLVLLWVLTCTELDLVFIEAVPDER